MVGSMLKTIGYLGDFSMICMKSLKDPTGSVIGSKGDYISILKGSHQDFEIIIVA